MSDSRKFISWMISWVMIFLFPLSLLAADTGAAIVHSKGGVLVNGAEVVDSTAVFPGDLLETKPGFVANLDAEGSSILIQGESVVKIQANSLTLEHGSVSVGTSTSMSVQVNCIKVEPLSNERTQYEMSDVSRTVNVTADKNDVKITQGGPLRKTAAESSSSQSAIVHEGQQVMRDESTMCGPTPRPGPAGNVVNMKWVEIGAGAGAGVLVLCLTLCKGSGSTSVSPSQP